LKLEGPFSSSSQMENTFWFLEHVLLSAFFNYASWKSLKKWCLFLFSFCHRLELLVAELNSFQS
ncbi:MAG: hypothetical protein ACRCVE_06335, partial [Plesiomonas sp.]